MDLVLRNQPLTRHGAPKEIIDSLSPEEEAQILQSGGAVVDGLRFVMADVKAKRARRIERQIKRGKASNQPGMRQMELQLGDLGGSARLVGEIVSYDDRAKLAGLEYRHFEEACSHKTLGKAEIHGWLRAANEHSWTVTELRKQINLSQAEIDKGKKIHTSLSKWLQGFRNQRQRVMTKQPQDLTPKERAALLSEAQPFLNYVEQVRNISQ